MMHEVFIYTERVIAMVRPRKLLVIAIDGVAPRAKMNQQRSRRFRSAEEARVKEEERIKAIEEWEGEFGSAPSGVERGGREGSRELTCVLSFDSHGQGSLGRVPQREGMGF
jgi:5'-3' exonuclease